jgi:ferritin-like metal-binding protein YciE
MALESLDDLYLEQLKDMYNAEKQLVRALPKMAKAASHPDLQAAFREHLEVTQEQVNRLEQIFDSLGEAPRGKKCVGMEGLVEEGAELIEKKSKSEGDVIDAGLIGAAQKVEHYEIAAYGTLRALAHQLGRSKDAKLLQRTLDEEGETDKKLTVLAENMVNQEAAAVR